MPTIAAGIEPTESLLKSVEVHGPELYMTTYWTPMGLIYPFDVSGTTDKYRLSITIYGRHLIISL